MTTNEDQAWLDWQAKATSIYDSIYYQSNPLVASVNLAGHRQMETALDARTPIGKVLEVGAGSGFHFEFVRHPYDEYVFTDISSGMLDIARERFGDRPGVRFEIQDATQLTYEENSFDRLISVYNLEHLPHPHRVLKEWMRVVRPGGLISISIPLDGGLAWRLGRFLTTRRSFASHGLNLDYIIAREHVNTGYNLIALIRHYFQQRQEIFFPFRIPSADINLVFTCNIRVPGK